MISVDIETSGTDFRKSGIWQIGAIDLETGEEFLEEGRIDDDDKIANVPEDKKTMFEVTGKTEKELRDQNKQSQKELLKKFFDWIYQRNEKFLLCMNPVFDIGFFNIRLSKYKLKRTFNHRSFDLQNIAQMKYFQLNNKFRLKEKFGLKEILEFCGIKDERKFHNALEDAKLTGECFFRLVYGKGYFKEFEYLEIPEYLKE